MKKKYRDLSKNMMLFTISSLGQKVLAFLLVPLYTNFLLTEEYGQIDLITTTLNLLLPIITLNIAEAVMRFTLDDKNNSQFYFYGCGLTIRGILGMGIVLLIASCIPAFKSYNMFFMWIFVATAFDSVYILNQSYLRAVDKIEVMVVGSLIYTVTTLTLNILLIAKLRMGVTGYYVSYVLGLILASLYMVVRGKIYLVFAQKTRNDKNVQKMMVTYSIPTILTAVAWWVNSSLDKYFVSGICGVDQNGIYSMAYKIPTILTAFQLVFTRAWTISAIVEFDKDDKDGFFGKTYEMYSSAMAITASGIMIMNIVLSRILFAGDFFYAWKYVPLLISSTYFSAMSGYLGSIFLAVKDTKASAYSVFASALVNVVLNAVLIPQMGVIGAAIATAISYFVAWLMRLIISMRYIKMQVDCTRAIIVDVLLLVQVFLASGSKQFYFAQLIVILVIIGCYYRKYISMIRDILAHIKKKTG